MLLSLIMLRSLPLSFQFLSENPIVESNNP